MTRDCEQEGGKQRSVVDFCRLDDEGEGRCDSIAGIIVISEKK